MCLETATGLGTDGEGWSAFSCLGGQLCNDCGVSVDAHSQGLTHRGNTDTEIRRDYTYGQPVHLVRERRAEGASFEDRCLIVFDFNGSGFYP